MPVLCNYYVTYRCNAKCGFCDIWEQPSPMIALDDAERNLDDLKRLGVRVIDFTGGEPLLHKQLPELLQMAKDRGFLTTVTSNGLLYPKKAKALAGNVDLLHFSIDSSVPEEHNASRGVNCFGKLMESIEVAMALGERPDLLFTVTNESVHRLDEIYETISYPNKLMLIINPLFEYNSLGDQLAGEVMAKMEAFARKPYTYLNPAFLSLRRAGGNDPENPVCKAVSTCVVISPFNELVLPCYHYGLDRLPIGGQLYDLWQSDTVKRHQEQEGRHSVCKSCTINCYFEPSFATTPTSKYFWQSLPSKVHYSWTKFVVQRLRARLGDRKAVLPEYEKLVAKKRPARPKPPAPKGDGAPSDLIMLPVLDAKRRPGPPRDIAQPPVPKGDGSASGMIALPVLDTKQRPGPPSRLAAKPPPQGVPKTPSLPGRLASDPKARATSSPGRP
ncbi:MAG: radical SAM protein [Bacteroidota bacterium]